MKSPGADQRPTSVATRSGQDYDAAVPGIATEKSASGQMGQVPSRVFHHLFEPDFVIFRHGPVNFHHLLGRDIGNIAFVRNEVHGRGLLREACK